MDVISKPTYLDYGLYSVSIREEMVMDPLFPVSDAFLSIFSIIGDLPSGLHFNKTTGVISGIPILEQQKNADVLPKRNYHIQVVGSNHFGSVKTHFYINVNPFSEKANRGVLACTVSLPSIYKGVAEELFSGMLMGNCEIQSSFSWVPIERTVDDSVQMTQNIRLVSFFMADYSAPYSFILKSAAEAVLYLDDYANPLLQVELTSQPVHRRVTIMLSSGLHRFVLYSTDSYVSLFYGSNSLGIPDTLMTHNTLYLPVITPLFSFFPAVTGFEGIPLDMTLQGWQNPSKLILSMTPDTMITTSPYSVRVVNPVVGEYDFTAIAYTQGGSRLIQQTFWIEEPREGMTVTVRSKLNPEVILLQKEIESIELFTEQDLPKDGIAPLLSYRSTLQLFTLSPFGIEVDKGCKVMLNNHELKSKRIYVPSSLNETLSLEINCIGIQNYHTLMIVFNTSSSEDSYRLLSPLSSFSYQYPVYHCIQGQSCPVNDIIALPSNCTVISLSHLPVGFSLFSNGTLTCGATQAVPLTSLTVGCQESSLRIPLQVSVGEPIIKPTSLLLTVNGQEIGDSVSLPLGKVFFITVVLDHSHGVTLTSVPPLPSSILLSPTSITGNVTEVLSNNYTLIASNAAGAVSKRLFIQTEVCTETFYYVRFTVGKGQSMIKLDSEVLFDHSVDPSVVVPVCTTTGDLTVSYQCSSPQGCWFTVYRNEDHLPFIFVRYNKRHIETFSFPYSRLYVNPLQQDFVFPIGQSISSILWYHHGFFSSVVLHGLPDWITYDRLENCVTGYAEEAGVYEGSIEIQSMEGSILFDVGIEVVSEKEIQAMQAQPVVIEMLNEVESVQFPWFIFNGNLTYDSYSLTNITAHRILQSILIPRGDCHIQSIPDSMEWFVYHEDMLIAHRDSNEQEFVVEMDPFVNRGDSWLLYPNPDPPLNDWSNPLYDDGFWIAMSQSIVPVTDGNVYIRQHFTPIHTYYSSLLLHLTVRSPVQVYVSGQLVLEKGLSPSNSDSSYQPLIDMPLEPITYHLSIPLSLIVNDTVIGIHLVTPKLLNESLIEFQVEGVVGSIQQTTVHTPICRSEPVVATQVIPESLLSPFTLYLYGSSVFPSFIILSFPHPVTVSTFILYSSGVNLLQYPTSFEIYGELLDGTPSLLSSYNHALLWTKQRSPLKIRFASSVIRSLFFVVYGSGFVGNDGHYFGRIVVSAETPVFCPALENVAKTAGGECVLETIHHSSKKGFIMHCCRVEQDKNHTLHRWGEWSTPEPHVSALVPLPHQAFVQFMMSITHIQPIIAQYKAPRDIETCLMVLLRCNVLVYSVVDTSEATDSIFLYRIQVNTKASQANLIAKRISSLLNPLLQLLNQIDGESYGSITAIEVHFNPVIVVAPKPLWEKILMIVVPLIVGGSFVVLVIVYRRPLLHRYHEMSYTYRQNRRKEVFESLGIPADMYFLPIEGGGEKSFETPYGNIHLVRPIVKTKKCVYSESFVQASQPSSVYINKQ